MKKAILIILGVIVALVVILFLAGGGANTNQNGEAERKEPAPAFSLQDYNGNTVSLSDFAGKSLIINSWATWCPFCVKELPDFVEIQKEEGDDLVVIAINRRESLEIAKDFTDDLGISEDIIFLLAPDDSFHRSIQGYTMPETIFVDKDGIIQDRKRGFMDLDEIRQRAKKIL